MKGAKQQKKQSIWDQVKNEEKDFYFNYLSKKQRNLQKKQKDIADLEELQKTKELKPEQVQKIQSKEENNEKLKELEAQLSNWLQAKKEAEQSGTLLTQEAFILILEHLSQNQDTVALLSQDHNSLYELAKLLQNRVNGQLRKKDQLWKGLNLKHQVQSEQQPQEDLKVQTQQQELPQPNEIVEVQKEQPQQHEQYVLIKSSPKKSFQEETRTQVHQTQDQQIHQHSNDIQQQEIQNQEPNTNHNQEQTQEPIQNEDQNTQNNQDRNHKSRDGHRQHYQNDTNTQTFFILLFFLFSQNLIILIEIILNYLLNLNFQKLNNLLEISKISKIRKIELNIYNQRKGYKKNYHNDKNYDRRNNGEEYKNRPYRGNRQHHNRDRQQKEEWQEKKEIVEQQQNNDNQSAHSSDAEYITIERKQKKPNQKPQRGGNRNRQQRQGETQQTVNVEQ